jgi:hypothetical protein
VNSGEIIGFGGSIPNIDEVSSRVGRSSQRAFAALLCGHDSPRRMSAARG